MTLKEERNLLDRVYYPVYHDYLPDDYTGENDESFAILKALYDYTEGFTVSKPITSRNGYTVMIETIDLCKHNIIAIGEKDTHRSFYMCYDSSRKSYIKDVFLRENIDGNVIALINIDPFKVTIMYHVSVIHHDYIVYNWTDNIIKFIKAVISRNTDIYFNDVTLILQAIYELCLGNSVYNIKTDDAASMPNLESNGYAIIADRIIITVKGAIIIEYNDKQSLGLLAPDKRTVLPIDNYNDQGPALIGIKPSNLLYIGVAIR